MRTLTPEEELKLAEGMQALNEKIDAVIDRENANWPTELFVLTRALVANGLAWGLSPEQLIEQTILALHFHFEGAEEVSLN